MYTVPEGTEAMHDEVLCCRRCNLPLYRWRRWRRGRGWRVLGGTVPLGQSEHQAVPAVCLH